MSDDTTNPSTPLTQMTSEPADEFTQEESATEEFEATEEFIDEIAEFEDDEDAEVEGLDDEAEAEAEEEEVGEVERVSKLIARAGIASRRAAEDLITSGQVSVNGHFVREPGVKANPQRDKIVVDGRPLIFTEKTVTVLVFHKPKNTVTTRDDPQGRPTVFTVLGRKWAKLHPVGRLDFDTSGVLLLTDDGELTHLLTHPSHGAEKIYEARVRGTVTPAAIALLEKGVRLEDGVTAPCRARVIGQAEKNALVELRLREGKNRQVRRMLEAVGHPVSSLRRISFAGIVLEGLPAGESRLLLPGEIKQLRKRVAQKVKKINPRAQRPVQSKTASLKPAPSKKGPPKTEKGNAKGGAKSNPKSDSKPAAKQPPTKPTPAPRKSDLARKIERKWK